MDNCRSQVKLNPSHWCQSSYFPSCLCWPDFQTDSRTTFTTKTITLQSAWDPPEVRCSHGGEGRQILTLDTSLSLCLPDLWLIHMMPCNVKQMLVKLRTLNECVMCWVHFWQCCSHSEPDLQLDYERQMYFQFSWKLVVSMIGYMTGFVFSAAVLYHLWQTAPVFVRTFWVIPLQANSWFSY